MVYIAFIFLLKAVSMQHTLTLCQLILCHPSININMRGGMEVGADEHTMPTTVMV